MNSPDLRKRRGFELLEAVFRPCIFVTIIAFMMAFLMRIQNVYLRNNDYETIYKLLFLDIPETFGKFSGLGLFHLVGWLLELQKSFEKFLDFGQFADPQSLLGAPAILIVLGLVTAALAHILRTAATGAQGRVVAALADPKTAEKVAVYYDLSGKETSERAYDVQWWPLSWPEFGYAVRLMISGIFCYVFYRVAFIWMGFVVYRSIQGRWSERGARREAAPAGGSRGPAPGRARRSGSAPRVRRVIAYALVAFAAYACIVVLVNRFSEPDSEPFAISPLPRLARAGDTISLLTWNLGYAGLGAASDFVADGGTHFLPPSRAAVLDNLRGIRTELGRVESDLILLQEVALASPLNYWVDVHEGVGAQLDGYASVFDADVATRLLPPPLRIAHGAAIYSRVHLDTVERQALPLEDELIAGLLRRRYRMQIARVPIANAPQHWVIVNIHLAAFDKEAAVRRRQFREVMKFAVAEFAKGNPVVIGGDWNMEFVKDAFPHTTEDKHRFWLVDFPRDELPSGWKPVFDPKTPSVRTLYQPYVAGQNYVTVIDGFVVAPNVEVAAVRGIDTQFRYSDHQPVSATFRHRPDGR